MTVLDDVERLLLDRGLISAGMYFWFDLPDLPATAVMLTNNGGRAPEATNERRIAYRRPNVQALVRSDDPAAAYTLALGIHDALASVVNTTLNGVWYRAITPAGDIQALGQDESERTLFSVNANVERGES